ncbi:Oidioi.mRNA.OKI2018_I69.chr2.g6177.t1.cds [Oikopleura dioica]|uniref:Oidioi.mRNA.OKI2018_I69.chr2.g6177.t1.cds n=1 Tax=Oikopleura dioica TaxID=34765 RepID=A0ABN7T344_OIKDI|nr:Oidioi.mRNA.OKI2018_I69.chr2.g6177.t1.cds [Oikopleura dioica]
MCKYCTSINPLQEALNGEKRCRKYLWDLDLGIPTVEDDAPPKMIIENALENQGKAAEKKDEEVTRIKEEVENLKDQLQQKSKELEKAKLENRLDSIILWVLADSIVKYVDKIVVDGDTASVKTASDSGCESEHFTPIDEYEELAKESFIFDFNDQTEWPVIS